MKTDDNPEEVDGPLLAYLRRELREPGLEYDQPPVILPGGFDTRVMRFRLDRGPMQRDLVLRLFREGGDPSRVRMESLVQSTLSELGYPAAPVECTCTDAAVLGAPFMIMRFLPGESLLSALGEPEASRVMGRAHAQLHRMDPHPLETAVADAGLVGYRLAERLDAMAQTVSGTAWLERIFSWLVHHAPADTAVGICHGDFHKLNLLVEGERLSGVVDWSNFVLMSPTFDVVTTVISFQVISKHLIREGLFDPVDLDAVVTEYLDAYESVIPLDRTDWEYYWALRSALIVAFAYLGVTVFRHRPLLDELATGIREITGVAVDLPDALR